MTSALGLFEARFTDFTGIGEVSTSMVRCSFTLRQSATRPPKVAWRRLPFCATLRATG
ncbi:hypothetical protein SBADM41S_01584 [Streptomyces badius]